MTRVLAAALLTAFTITASAGFASAATQGSATTGSSVGTAAVTTPAPQGKAVDNTKPVTHKKKDKAAQATVAPMASHPASKMLDTSKPAVKPAS